jgi:hypothetical protein
MKLPGLSEEALEELLSMPLVAKLATHEPDATIRMTPIWFRKDSDGSILMATWRKTAAARNISIDPRCSLLIDVEEREPYYGVHFFGSATIEGPRTTPRRSRTFMSRTRAAASRPLMMRER